MHHPPTYAPVNTRHHQAEAEKRSQCMFDCAWAEMMCARFLHIISSVCMFSVLVCFAVHDCEHSINLA